MIQLIMKFLNGKPAIKMTQLDEITFHLVVRNKKLTVYEWENDLALIFHIKLNIMLDKQKQNLR